MPRKLTTWTLAGLMVGPILGSGVVLLPPLAYARLGPQALWAWVAILVLGAAFAAIFIQMALRSKTASGLAELVAGAWGPGWGELASNFLTGAVVFGAVPVFLTAARLWPPLEGLGHEALAGVFLVVTFVLLWAGLTTVSRLSLVLSSLTAVLLLAGGILGLVAHGGIVLPSTLPEAEGLGPTLLLLFWAVVGWEVIGNYSNDVAHPEKTIPRAGLLSLAAVSLVYLMTTVALQTLAPQSSQPPTVATVLFPLFGPAATVVAGLIAGGLCLTSVLMFIGAVTRMTDHRARSGALPRWLAGRADRPPRRAIAVQSALSVVLLVLVGLHVITLEDLVAVSNLFFLGNALLGLAAAWKLLPGVPAKTLVAGLAVVLVLLLAQGSWVGWLFVVGVAALSWLKSRSA